MFDVMSKLGTHNYCDYTDDLLENIITELLAVTHQMAFSVTTSFDFKI